MNKLFSVYSCEPKSDLCANSPAKNRKKRGHKRAPHVHSDGDERYRAYGRDDNGENGDGHVDDHTAHATTQRVGEYSCPRVSHIREKNKKYHDDYHREYGFERWFLLFVHRPSISHWFVCSQKASDPPKRWTDPIAR